MSKTVDERSIIVTDSLKLPDFSRDLHPLLPGVVRAIRESPNFENRVQMAIETPQTPEERDFGEGFINFLKNKNYLVMVLTHYEALFAKPYKNWTDESWHMVSHNEAQALLPIVEQGCLSEGDIKTIWGEGLLKLKPEQRIARVVELLTTFLHQVFRVAITRDEIKELIKQNRSDTIAPLVSEHPSSKPPVAQVAEWEGQFQQYFAQVPAKYQGKEHHLYYRFAFFRNPLIEAFQRISSVSSLSMESQEHAFAHLEKQTGIAYDVIKKAYFVYTQDPELVKNPNSSISHIMDRERSMRIEEAKRQLENSTQSITDIKKITQGLTNVRGDNPNMPEGTAMQIVTKEGMVACVYANESRMVVRYPRLEYDMHKIYEKVRGFVESQRASGKEILSSAALQKLKAILESQIDGIFNTYYTQVAYNQSPQVLAELRKIAEGRCSFHAENVTQILKMVDGLRALVHNGFNPTIFKTLESLFAHDNADWNETMTWISSPAIVSGDMSDEKFALIEQHVAQVTEGRNELANIRMANRYFAHLKHCLQKYVANLFPSEQDYAQTSIDALVKLEQKWRSFSDCYDALSKPPHEDQSSKQEFLLWINILSDTLTEQEKQLKQAAQNIEPQLAALETVMCRGEVADSVWGWAQKQYEMRNAGKDTRLQSAACIPLVKRFFLEEETMKMVWQEWQKKILNVILNNQIPPEKEALFELVLANMPASEQAIGRFPKVYPEFWYIKPEKYLGVSGESKVPLADALMITVSTDQGKLEQWQLLYTLGTLKLRKIADVPGGHGSRAQTMFSSEGH